MNKKSSNNVDKFLNIVEKVGNKLPHPVVLFFILSVAVIILSGIGESLNLNVTYTGFNNKSKLIETMNVGVKSLLTKSGILYIFTSFTSNYINYAPLGLMLVTIVGIGIVEKTGLLVIILKKIISKTSPRYITLILVFLGVMSNIAADAIGYLILIPIGAKIFKALGRHPLAGFAATFFGVSGGFAANLLLGPGDAILSGISTEAIHILNGSYYVLPTSNWYFMIVSTFLITIIGTIITEKMIEPRLGKYAPEDGENVEESIDLGKEISEDEKKGLKTSLMVMVIFIMVLLVATVPTNGAFRQNNTLNLFLSKGLIPTIMLFFMLPGIAFGIKNKTITDTTTFSKMAIESLSEVGGFLAFALFASQFIVYFNYSNIGIILAVKGATLLKELSFTGIPLVILFLILTCCLNLFMGSASAKWSIMAPVFIPMFHELGYTPEFTQLIFRIGDSSTNVISPLMTYFAIILVFLQKYNKKAGIGNLISLMLPYSIITVLSWTVLLIVWFLLRLPLGPGSFVLL